MTNDHLFIGAGTILQVFSLWNPARPALVSEIPVDGVIRGITLKQADTSAQYALVAASKAGLIIVDVTDPLTPRKIGSVPSRHFASDVAIQGRYAYVADFDFGDFTGNHSQIQAIDLYDIAHPYEAGTIDLIGATGCAVYSQFLWVACSGIGIKVIDTQDPSAMREIASYALAGGADNVRIRMESNNRLTAYACSAYHGLTILDATDPYALALIGTFTDFGAYDIAFTSLYALISGLFDGFVILDISDPSRPMWVSTLSSADRDTGVAFAGGDYVYLANFGGLRVVDIRDPIWPDEIYYLPTGRFWGDIVYDGVLAYLAGGEGGIRIIDLSDNENPMEVGRFDTKGQAQGIIKSGQFLFIADMTGISILDISEPSSPIELNYFRISCSVRVLNVQGSTLYAGCAEGGLKIVNIGDILHPVEMGSYESSGSALCVAVYSTQVLMANYAGGLIMIDVSDPWQPRETWRLAPFSTTNDVEIVGDRAFVTDSGGWLIVLNLKGPAQPEVIGIAPVAGDAKGVLVVDHHAFIESWWSGVLHYDISEPSNPQLVETIKTPGFVSGLARYGYNLVVSDAEAGVEVYRIHDCIGHRRPLGPP